jgi:hypothetical protein
MILDIWLLLQRGGMIYLHNVLKKALDHRRRAKRANGALMAGKWPGF